MKPSLLLALFTIFFVTACSVDPSDSLSQQAAQSTLDRAQTAYDDGNYGKAISILRNGSAVFESAAPPTRLQAMKLEAFSYCVSNQIRECRAQFGRILRAYPNFELSVAERRHPTWGAAYEYAKQQTGR